MSTNFGVVVVVVIYFRQFDCHHSHWLMRPGSWFWFDMNTYIIYPHLQPEMRHSMKYYKYEKYILFSLNGDVPDEIMLLLHTRLHLLHIFFFNYPFWERLAERPVAVRPRCRRKGRLSSRCWIYLARRLLSRRCRGTCHPERRFHLWIRQVWYKSHAFLTVFWEIFIFHCC